MNIDVVSLLDQLFFETLKKKRALFKCNKSTQTSNLPKHYVNKS